MKSEAEELIMGCLKIIFSLIISIIMFIMIISINKRTKLIEQRTRFLIEKDTLIIKEIGNKEYYYKETFIEGEGPGLKLTNTYEGKGVIIKSK